MRRGTSTPSLTMRTATIQRSLPAEKALIFELALGSSESTTVGLRPVMASSCLA